VADLVGGCVLVGEVVAVALEDAEGDGGIVLLEEAVRVGLLVVVPLPVGTTDCEAVMLGLVVMDGVLGMNWKVWLGEGVELWLEVPVTLGLLVMVLVADGVAVCDVVGAGVRVTGGVYPTLGLGLGEGGTIGHTYGISNRLADHAGIVKVVNPAPGPVGTVNVCAKCTTVLSLENWYILACTDPDAALAHQLILRVMVVDVTSVGSSLPVITTRRVELESKKAYAPAVIYALVVILTEFPWTFEPALS
jgi:hypothetical protein